ncbi:myotubularin-related protein 9-like isoform X5 [Brienomyrus brachyistius]|uniref:myotubularin-related protein 9-like isoform X5 n=1 Tax=Brienomyrus brachyistius TaxID=42636 RepID=UPI0020B19755|nr:myotubularin-related protein 9-like isoform X5 [Brienomyrus brachyistius]
MEFAEHIRTANVENVVLTQQLGAPLKGTLCVTGHHLLLFGRDGDSAAQLLLLLRNIDAVEKRAIESSGTITIKCKDLRILQLDIPGMEECLNVASSIEALSSLDTVADLYPFYYRPSHLSLKGPWGLSLPVQDFAELSAQTGRWRLSEVNRDYSVCLSYPPAVIVPHTVDDNTLRKVARFRQGGRFPVLCYYHRPNNTVIMRSSQPLQGANRKRCREDESLLHAVIDGLPQGYIIDTRSAQLAQQARVIGGGFESKANYSNWKRLHRNLERGKPLLEAFVKLVEACSDQWQSVERWLSRLESSRWLSHVQNTLSAVGLLAECVEREGCPVLVHGSEGTDTTLLLTTLAQLILDPRCRTLPGFLALLEREWVLAGHPFQQRYTHSAYSHARPRQEAPVFLLLLDCVWQLQRQFPLAMAFGEPLLLRLAQEAYASNFGTFLCNSDAERCYQAVKEKTHCLFQFLLRPEERERFANPLYQPTELAIWPSVYPQCVQLWQGGLTAPSTCRRPWRRCRACWPGAQAKAAAQIRQSWRQKGVRPPPLWLTDERLAMTAAASPQRLCGTSTCTRRTV